jgi:Microtubule-binding stalk of dynein motor
MVFVNVLQALEALNKKDITEIKSYGKPPALVEKVLEAVMILRGQEPTWAEAKKQLGNILQLFYIESAHKHLCSVEFFLMMMLMTHEVNVIAI